MTADLQHLVLPTSQPTGAAALRIELGARLEATTTWSIDTLNAGPARSAPDYDRHVAETVGSSYDWSDELRFDKRSGRLVSFVIKTPEAGTLDAHVAESWLALPPTVGLPVLVERARGFHVDPVDLRYLSERANALVCGAAELPVADRASVSVAIEGDVMLLFHRARYVGWILREPIRHLVSEIDDKPMGTDAPSLHAPLRAYLSLVVEPNIEKMSDEDPAIRTALQQLLTSVRAIDGGQARALCRRIERVLDTFYSG